MEDLSAHDKELIDHLAEAARTAKKLGEELHNARQGALTAIQRLAEADANATKFLDEQDLSPDIGEMDRPPEHLAYLVRIFGDRGCEVSIQNIVAEL